MTLKGKKVILTKVEPVSEIVSTYGATDYVYILMRLHGYLMPKRFKYIYCIYACLAVGSASIYFPYGFARPLFEDENLKNDLSAFFTTLQTVFSIFGGAIKVIFLGLMLHKLHSTRPLIDKLDERCKDLDEVNEQKRIVYFGRKIVCIFMTIYLAFSTLTVVGGLMNGRPPYSIYLPYINWRHSRREFWIAVTIEFFSFKMACIQQGLNDTYATVFVCLLLAHVRILKMRISKLGAKPESNKRDNVEALKMCIKDHKIILQIQETIEPLISFTIFIQFVVTGIVLGTTLVNIMVISTDFSVRLGSVFYFTAICFQSFPLCYFAESLRMESAELSDKIFHSEWIYQNVEYRKLLVVFMQRSQFPIRFTAGKMFEITLSTFIAILKFAFSCYTLLKKMNVDV